MLKKQLMTLKPAYRNGQLLLEEDFIDEQAFHVHARRRHSLHLHGFGVVQGLELARAGDMAVSVSPGFAIDRCGREIELREAETLELHQLPPGTQAWVTLGLQAEAADGSGEKPNRIGCYAVLRVATGVGEHDVRLGSVQLNDRGHLVRDPNRADRDVLQRLAPASVTPESLSPQLLRGWIRTAFHPTDIPLKDKNRPSAFSVGATETETETTSGEDTEGDRAAGGTMALMLPPGIRRLYRFRVAGGRNEKGMTVTLLKGGFDKEKKKHARDEVLVIEVPKGEGYIETAAIPEAHRDFSDHYRTLSVDIRTRGYAAISLIALDVSY